MKHNTHYLLIWILLLSSSYSNILKAEGIDSLFQVNQLVVTVEKGDKILDAIEEIEQTFSVKFTYESKIIKGKKISKDWTFMEDQLDDQISAFFLDHNYRCTQVSKGLYVFKSLPVASKPKPKKEERPQDEPTPLVAMISISGMVADDSGNPLVGVNIYEKSNPANGTTSDIDGSFSLNVDEDDAILVFSYLGYKSEELRATSTMQVTLYPDSEILNEVVVTALGIEKDEKLLTANVQALEAQEISRGRQESVLDALEGKVSGIQITSTSGAPGGSTEIILRGATSVDGNNQPLIVVDGIAISNARTSGTMNRAADLNPNDIASVSVLKGASAAALYGIDAANGAIIITTKSGQKGKIKVGFNGYTGVSTVANLHDQQNYFTTGFNGVFNSATFSHWGPKYRKSDQIHNNVQDFFKNGMVTKADLNISGGNDRLTYYFSASNLNDEGIVPNTDYSKNSVLMKVGSNLSKRLRMEATVNVINSNNRYGIVGASGGWLSTVYGWPRWDNMSQFLNENGSERNLYQPVSGDLSTVPDNPWWTANHKVRNDNLNRILGNLHFTFDVTDWLKLDYRYGKDFYNQHYKAVSEWGSSGAAYEGAITEFDRNSDKWTSTFLAIFEKNFMQSINVNAILGNNIQSDYAIQSRVTGTQFRNPDLHSINNLKDIQNSQFTARRRVVGLFGDLKVDYKRTLILGVTMRNDWSSTLPVQNRSFFYPSYSVGLIFSEMLPSTMQNVLSFGKIRASYAVVGKDAPPHKLSQVLTQYFGPEGGWKNGAFAGNPALMPEITKELEVGIDLRFFKGRFGIDATYYNRVSNDQIITPRVTPVTGAILQTVNSGSVENKGLEVALNATPIRMRNFTWDINVNAFGNRSKLTKLFGDLVEFPVTFGQVSSIAIASSRLGEPLFGIIGTDYQRNDEGRVIVGEDGYPLIDSEKKYIGNREPKMWYGITNTFNIHNNFELSVQLDGARGAQILNATGGRLVQRGLHTMIEDYRRQEFVFDGVIENEDGSFTENSKPVVLDRDFFTTVYGLAGTNFVETVDWVRVRNIGLTYYVPEQFASKVRASDASINITFQNLFLFSNYSGGDPQVNNAGPNGGGASGAGTMGVDYFQVPARRSFSIGITTNF